MLESSDIQIVQAISDSGSLSRAAEILHMSQPTLSKRLTRLEHSLGISLFHRHNGGMLPTEPATFIIQNGMEVRAKLNSMQRHIEMLSNLEGGNLKIGVGPIIEQLYFPKVLLDLTEETKNLKISIVTEPPQKLVEHLKKGFLDVIVGPFTKEDLPDDFTVIPIQRANIILIARSGHPLLQEDKITQTTLARYPIISPAIPERYQAMLSDSSQLPSPLITCENYNTSKSVVLVSDYITGGPELLFRKELNEGSLVKLPLNLPLIWTANCAIKPESMTTPAIKKFIEVFDRYL